ncbi:hypothetical protein J2853_007711 [Streptosporangium lutulentum]|uniref:Uncharacterized protein n=1 Tax=Streptosporangium lutulentum TaxID=1461250 RepID=A0ABT9QP22_9ACTN|nr:hypothetical protein [Streptosporangium lutulentum]
MIQPRRRRLTTRKAESVKARIHLESITIVTWAFRRESLNVTLRA